MKQFLLSEPPGREELTIRGRDFHYLCRVRRMRSGAKFTGVDPAGLEYDMIMLAVAGDHCVVGARPRSRREAQYSEENPQIVLVQCLPKGRKLDTIVRQATECGVAEIHPVTSERAVPVAVDTDAADGRHRRRPSDDDASRRTARLRRIAREAFQQSGNAAIPEIFETSSLAAIGETLALGNRSLGLFFHEVPLATGSLHGYLSTGPTRIVLVVGPEGGLSDGEIGALQRIGFRPVYFGPGVLRTETAAIYGIAAVRTIALERKTWQIE